MYFFPWFAPPPGGPRDPSGQTVGLRPGPRWGCWWGHSHVYGRDIPHPGAPAFAYEALGLAEFSPIGPATVNRGELSRFNQTAFASTAQIVTGLGGLVRGQFVTSPLVVIGGNTQSELTDLALMPSGEPWIG